MAEHRITWWVYAGTERIRRTSTMRGTWGYDATCSCGWDSQTGGATRTSVERAVSDHKWDVDSEAELAKMTARLDSALARLS